MKDLFRIISHRFQKNKKQSVSVLAIIITFVMVYSLIMPAVAIERDAAEKEPGLTIEETASESVAAEAMAEAEPASLEAEVSEEAAEEEAVAEEPAVEEPAAEEIETEAAAPAAAPAQSAADASNVAADTSAAQQAANIDAAQTNTGAAQADENKANADSEADPSDSDTKTSDAEEEMPAQNFEQVIKYKEIIDEDGNTVDKEIKVVIDAAKDTFPAGTTMKAELILNNADVEKAVEDAVKQAAGDLADATSIVQYRAVDITFADKDGQKVEPAKKVEVRITSDKIAEIVNPMLVHVNVNDQNGRVINADVFPKNDVSIIDEKPDTIDDNENTMLFKASRFSPYVIVESQTIDEDGDAVHGLNGVEENADNGAEADAANGKSGSVADGVLIAESDNYTVTIKFDEDANLPEDAEIEINEIPEASRQYQSYMGEAEKLLTGDENASTAINYAKIVDVNIVSATEGTVTPEADVDVDIAYNKTEEIAEGTVMQALSFNGRTPAVEEDALVYGGETYVDGLQVTTDKLPVYGIVGTETIETTVLTADGSTYKITVDLSNTTNIPKDATLEAKEIVEGTDEYEEYFDKTAKEIDRNMTLSFARFFDIEIRANGEKIEPDAPVQISIEYLDGTDITGSAAIGVIHFAEDGTELIDEVKADIEGSQMKSIEYMQDSLSVIGTIGTSGYTSLNSVADQMFVIYTQKNNTPYALTHTYGDAYEGADITTSSPSVLVGTDIDSLVVWHAEKADDGYRIYYEDLDESARKHYLVVDDNGALGDSKTETTVWSSESGYLKYQNGNRTGYLAYEEGSLTTEESIGSATQIFFATVEVNDPYLNDGLGPVVRAANLRATNDAPAHAKTLTPNNDGTYTLALSVTGATSSSSTTQVTKANVILVLDTSNSMYNNYTNYNGNRMRRLAAEKRVLTDNGGIIDSLLAQNVAGDAIKSDIIEVAIANFDTRGSTAQSFTTSATALKSTINGLGHNSGTNWEEGLMRAQELATSIKTSQPNEEVYVIFLTDGEPTTHHNSYNVNTNYATEWGYANDNARAIVTAGHHFYGIFTWGSGNSSHYLSSLVNYAYTGNGNSSSSLAPAYADYFTDATSTEALIEKLNQITHDITTAVGYTNVELTDGVTEMTTSNVKTTAGGTVTGLKYYRSGGDYSTTANNGLGEEWTDAPAATINSKGEVDWNLGNTVLENGVTYTVTFVVWPSQESIDLVADLNNGLKQYDSLSPEEKAQVSVSGGKYHLKTNTDYPTVTYSTVTTTTVDGKETTVISDPTTINITNPDPVDLFSEKLTVEKKWDDATDDSQRPDSISLDLYKKGSTSDSVYLNDITLNNTNNWKLEDYAAIAPGIMVSSTSPAYSTDYPQQTFGGKTYAVLESGHDYYFQEDPMDYHFELTAYTYHPMLVDNVLYNVTYNDDGTIKSMDTMATMISATNTLKGRLHVTKEVSIPEGAIGYDLDTTSFPITITLKDKDGNPIEGEGTSPDNSKNGVMYRIRYGAHNPNKGEWSEEYQNYGQSDQTTFTGGTISENIYAGDTIYVGNLPTGATYEVSEGTLTDGWELDSIVYGNTDKTISGNVEDAVTVKNKLPCVDVVIQKRQQDAETALPGAVFDVYTEEAYGKDPRDAKLITVTSDTNGLLKLGVLSAGTYYLVETSAPDGYNKLADAAVLKVEDGKITVWQNTESTAQPRIDTTPADTTYDAYITNDQGVELPNTGGPGTLLYTLSGLALMLGAALMYGFRMRRRERRLN